MGQANLQKLIDLVEEILSSFTLDPEQGARCAFTFSPNRRTSEYEFGGIGVEIFFDFKILSRVSVMLRSCGGLHLKNLPRSEISSMVIKFVRENFHIIGRDIFSVAPDKKFNELLDKATKIELANELSKSAFFYPDWSKFIFPLCDVTASEDYFGTNFSFVRASSLIDERIVSASQASNLLPDTFPPLLRFQGRRRYPASWLIVESANERTAKRLMNAVLGSFSLAVSDRQRYLFSGRTMFGGLAELKSASLSFTMSDPLTPGLMNNLILGKQDAAWMGVTDELLKSSDIEGRRQLKSLEYYYRSWPGNSSDRFVFLCMAMEALFGNANESTSSVIEGIQELFDPELNRKRLRLLMKLRGAVFHGSAPEIYDSSKYAKYVADYSSDPAEDLEVLIAECLKRSIFGDRFSGRRSDFLSELPENHGGEVPNILRHLES